MSKLTVEYIPLLELRENENNAKEHPPEQLEQIKKSIEDFGFLDPIGIWKDNIIIEGHGRYLAALELGLEEVPVIRLDSLTDQQRLAYGIVHNQLTMNSGFDLDKLNLDLDKITDYDMSDFGLDLSEDIKEIEREIRDNSKPVEIGDCYNNIETLNLLKEIKKSNVSSEERSFLVAAAYRHCKFNFSEIAEYYETRASGEMKELMEHSNLVTLVK